MHRYNSQVFQRDQTSFVVCCPSPCLELHGSACRGRGSFVNIEFYLLKKKALKYLDSANTDFLFSDVFDHVSIPWICFCLPVIFFVPGIRFLTLFETLWRGIEHLIVEIGKMQNV